MAVVRVGVVADARARVIEDVLITELQQSGSVTFLERTQLSLIGEELSMQDVFGAAGWEACDLLILLNTFAENENAMPSLVVRVISTHTMQVIGLWRHPFVSEDPMRLAGLAAAPLRPLLSNDNRTGVRRVVSLGLLRTDSPRLACLTESATYKLAVQLQAYPGLSLVERWDVRSPSFEQWLRKTVPAGLKAPDFVLEGTLADQGSGLGLRLELNGEPLEVLPEPGASGLDAVIVSAAERIATQAKAESRRPVKLEHLQFERNARWFWKWSAFAHAAASADTALYLGSKNPETGYIRALANLRFPTWPSYLDSNRTYGRAPSEELFARASYGLECFLQIPSPSASAPYVERIAYLRYAEQATRWAAQMLQVLHYSGESLPGTRTERQRFQAHAEELVERVWAFYPKATFASAKVPLLERVDVYGGDLLLPITLINYGAFLVSNPERLSALYAEWFEELARVERRDYTGPLLGHIQGVRTSLHHPWYLPGTGSSDRTAGAVAGFTKLVRHKNAEVRVMAACMPFRFEPETQSKDWRKSVVWLRWLIARVVEEEPFFVGRPSPYSHRMLSIVASIIDERRMLLVGRFPEAEWRECLRRLLEKVPHGSKVEHEWRTENLLRSLLQISLAVKHPVPHPTPAPADVDALNAWAEFVTAAPQPRDVSRVETTHQAGVAQRAFLERRQREEASKPAVGFEIDRTPRPILRTPITPPSGGSAALALDRLDLGVKSGMPVSVAPGAHDRVWLMFSDWETRSHTWLELGPDMTTILRTVRLRDLPGTMLNAEADVFGVRGDTLFCATFDALYVVDLKEATWQAFETRRMEQARVWIGRDKVWVTGKPGLIHEFQPEARRLVLVSSALRVPATNTLDGRNAYVVSAMIEHDRAWYAWIDGAHLYRRDETTADWREVYTTRVHLSPGKTYPADLLLHSLDKGREIAGVTTVLLSDPAMKGLLRGRADDNILTYPATGERRVGQGRVGFQNGKLWRLLHVANGGAKVVLRSLEQGSGRQQDFPLPKELGTAEPFFMERGIVFFDDARGRHVYHLPRERFDRSYVRSTPIPAPPEAADPSAPARYRRFTDTAGRTMDAEVLSFSDKEVTLRRSDGSVFTVALTLFAPADADYLTKRRDVDMQESSKK